MKISLLCFTVLFSLTVFSQSTLSNSQKAYGKRLNSAFNLKIKSGLTYASASVEFDSGPLRDDNQSVEFNKESSLRFGLEAE